MLNVTDHFEQSMQFYNLLQDYQKHYTNTQLLWPDVLSFQHIYQKWFSELAVKQQGALPIDGQFNQEWCELYSRLQQKLLGKQAPVLIENDDKRFKDKVWQEQPLYYFYHQAYLLYVKQTLAWLACHQSENPKIAQQISFFTKQYLDALSPSNYLLSNPEVLQQTLTQQGENILQGLQNWFQDLTKSTGYWQIQMTDMEAFAIGENIAVTPGKVIFQNRLMQLIQYEPTTKQVLQKPLLMIPPWINKYYILDLNEKKSLVKWLVDKGITVFMISWVNPDESYREVGFEDYLQEGVLTALEVIQQATTEESVNALGFCIGGTLLGVACAYLKAKNINTINSATFLTSLLDFREPGDIGVFIDEQQLQILEEKMALTGYLDGRAMMNTFNLLRANDLQWSYYINQYLRGQKPLPFDLLYWNSDPSNLPAKMHSYYLRNFYLENSFCVPNKMQMLNTPLDLTKVDIPCYFLSTAQDHIAPWQSTFRGAQYLAGPVTFVLGGSGHIAGVVNPPTQKKYGYHYGDSDLQSFTNPQEWLKRANAQEGSWWPHWQAWLQAHSGPQVKQRIPGSGKLKSLQDAPGDYVRKKIE